MKKKYYVVWVGRKPGIYEDWPTCKSQVDGYPGAKYKSYKSKDEAIEAAASGKAKSKPKSSPSIRKGETKAISGKQKSDTRTTKVGTVKRCGVADIVNMRVDFKIFADGACFPNPGEAGSGIAIYEDGSLFELWFGLYTPNGTNQSAELNALFHALVFSQDILKKGKSVSIFTDSEYSINCITNWAFSWEKLGWKRRRGEIKNLDIIKDSFHKYKSIKESVDIFHVYGHSGIEGNELADRMSAYAIDCKQQDLSLYEESYDIDTVLSLREG